MFRYRVQFSSEKSETSTLRSYLESWLEQPGLKRLVLGHGGSWPAEGDLVERLTELHGFSSAWDFREGQERLEMRKPLEGELDQALIERESTHLGMTVATIPQSESYDHALVLGGTLLANVNRMRVLFELLDNGLQVGHVTALTAMRPIAAQEVVVARHALGHEAEVFGSARSEFEVFRLLATRYVKDTGTVEYDTVTANARAEYDGATILAAPPAGPSARAATLDNYRAYKSSVKGGQSVLIVTSSIYLPYQFSVALRALRGTQLREIEAIGFPPSWMAGALTGPQNVLQELRSAFYGALTLAESL